MSAIIKTWPAFMSSRKVLEVFTHDWGQFYFTLGRARPKDTAVSELFYTHRGRILGHFDIGAIVQNAGQLPRLRSISGETSEWQIRMDAWVAICNPPIHRLKEKLYMPGFRGWHYFSLDSYRGTMEAKIPI